MKIIVDAMGGDNAPFEIVKGAVAAAEEFNVEIILTGRVEEILKVFESLGMDNLPRGIEIANASQVIGMEDDPASAVRIKKDSSMTVALNMLRDNAGEAMISAGSTGALLAGATLILKRIRGIRRAALSPLLPGLNGGTILIDCGANVDCKTEHLLQFAYMGAFYAKRVFNTQTPRVALLNIGAEESKGGELQKEVYKLLAEAGGSGRINFIGNLEARDVLAGKAEVLVADGFSGNVLLKALEGCGMIINRAIGEIYMDNAFTKLSGALVKKKLMKFRDVMDYREIGGTALMGIAKPVIKAHGASNARAIRSAIKQAVEFARSGIIEDIAANIEYMKLSPGGYPKNNEE